MAKKKFSGFTAKTAENLLLNAGAYFKNFDIESDTYESAVESGKLIGATRGGGEFSAVPTVRKVEVDGVVGRGKGLEVIDSWDVYIKANILEVSEESLKLSLCAAEVDTESNKKYDIITAKNEISLDDYIDNITWIGTISGSNEPAIITVYNALNTDGLKLTTQDKNEATISTTFYGHYTQDELDAPPFAIFYPKRPAASYVTKGSNVETESTSHDEED